MVKKVWQTDGQTDGLNQSYSCLVAAKNEIEGQGQSSLKIVRILKMLRDLFGPNSGIWSWIGDELLCLQAPNEVNLFF